MLLLMIKVQFLSQISGFYFTISLALNINYLSLSIYKLTAK